MADTTGVAPAAARAKRPSRAPEAQALVEKLLHSIKEPRKRVSETVDVLLDGGLTPAALGAVIDEVVQRHAEKPKENPLGYLVTVARQHPFKPSRTRPSAVRSVTATEEEWAAYTGPGPRPLGEMVRELREKLDARRAERKAPVADEPEEEAECSTCGGARLILTHHLQIAGSRAEQPRPVACPSCNVEADGERSARLLRLSGLQGFMMGMRLDALTRTPGLKKAIEAVERFAAGDILQIVLVGKSGRGKTHLAVAALLARLDKGQAGLYLNVARFLDAVRMSYESGAEETASSLMGPPMTWPVCVLDDLGAQRQTDWAVEKLYEVVDARYSAGLQTIACSNERPETWDPRVLSRLCDVNRGVVVSIPDSTPDYRLKGGA